MVQTYVASHLERTHGRKFHVGSYIPGFLKDASTFVAELHCHGVSNTCSSLDWCRDHVDDNHYCEECGGTKCRTASCRRNGCSYGILECSQRIRNFGTTAASGIRVIECMHFEHFGEHKFTRVKLCDEDELDKVYATALGFGFKFESIFKSLKPLEVWSWSHSDGEWSFFLDFDHRR